ncbi:MAG TPA: hypothetical protein VGW12_15400 [Pyrinomonadaceae bacterium]|nr:hypothetical protein [Pyrinomonadaceae bacterium]
MTERQNFFARAAAMLALLTLTTFQVAVSSFAQQVADPNFDTKIARPAYTSKHPKVLFDEAHNNFHTADGRYKPFADLIKSDGYTVTPNRQPFTLAALKLYDILIISNALGAPQMNATKASNSAFTDPECDAVRDWVRAGGALLFIADHAPMGAAAERLAERFGVGMSKAFTLDPANSPPADNNPGFILYTRENKLLGDHAITRGRDASERINRVLAFTGQSLKGSAESVAFMKLADTAKDAMPGTPEQTSAAGRAQGLAFSFGKGRVVVLGEAGMLSAQLAGADKKPFGMNRPGIDNRQLALNIMHWLSRLL